MDGSQVVFVFLIEVFLTVFLVGEDFLTAVFFLIVCLVLLIIEEELATGVIDFGWLFVVVFVEERFWTVCEWLLELPPLDFTVEDTLDVVTFILLWVSIDGGFAFKSGQGSNNKILSSILLQLLVLRKQTTFYKRKCTSDICFCSIKICK